MPLEVGDGDFGNEVKQRARVGVEDKVLVVAPAVVQRGGIYPEAAGGVARYIQLAVGTRFLHHFRDGIAVPRPLVEINSRERQRLGPALQLGIRACYFPLAFGETTCSISRLSRAFWALTFIVWRADSGCGPGRPRLLAMGGETHAGPAAQQAYVAGVGQRGHGIGPRPTPLLKRWIHCIPR